MKTIERKGEFMSKRFVVAVTLLAVPIIFAACSSAEESNDTPAGDGGLVDSRSVTADGRPIDPPGDAGSDGHLPSDAPSPHDSFAEPDAPEPSDAAEPSDAPKPTTDAPKPTSDAPKAETGGFSCIGGRNADDVFDGIEAYDRVLTNNCKYSWVYKSTTESSFNRFVDCFVARINDAAKCSGGGTAVTNDSTGKACSLEPLVFLTPPFVNVTGADYDLLLTELLAAFRAAGWGEAELAVIRTYFESQRAKGVTTSSPGPTRGSCPDAGTDGATG